MARMYPNRLSPGQMELPRQLTQTKFVPWSPRLSAARWAIPINYTIVGDRRWHQWLATLADPFYADDAEYFPSNEIDRAWAWLREDD